MGNDAPVVTSASVKVNVVSLATTSAVIVSPGARRTGTITAAAGKISYHA